MEKKRVDWDDVKRSSKQVLSSVLMIMGETLCILALVPEFIGKVLQYAGRELTKRFGKGALC